MTRRTYYRRGGGGYYDRDHDGYRAPLADMGFEPSREYWVMLKSCPEGLLDFLTFPKPGAEFVITEEWLYGLGDVEDAEREVSQRRGGISWGWLQMNVSSLLDAIALRYRCCARARAHCRVLSPSPSKVVLLLPSDIDFKRGGR